MFGVVVATSLGATGCGIGGGASDGAAADVRMVVTRDFGARDVAAGVTATPARGMTVMRMLQSRFEVESAYQGRFVTAIEGLASRRDPPTDWLYYVNGEESEIGAADRRVRPGDVVQWDLHRWDATKEHTATVGAFPRPLSPSPNAVHAEPAVLVCAVSVLRACGEAERRLRAADVNFRVAKARGATTVRKARAIVYVGRWRDLARKGAAALRLSASPIESGISVRGRAGSPDLDLYDDGGRAVRRLGPGGGVIAAWSSEPGKPRWVISGVDATGVFAAAQRLDRRYLADRFAVAVDSAGDVIPLPVTR